MGFFALLVLPQLLWLEWAVPTHPRRRQLYVLLITQLTPHVFNLILPKRLILRGI